MSPVPPSPKKSGQSGLSRLWWLMALKVVILAFAVLVALRIYHLI